MGQRGGDGDGDADGHGDGDGYFGTVWQQPREKRPVRDLDHACSAAWPALRFVFACLVRGCRRKGGREGRLSCDRLLGLKSLTLNLPLASWSCEVRSEV